ncbi:MAG TPA: hypothetical protein V6D14_10745 [Coleofasciculaceae cyanobacterium]|jgi:hypothetical protein
MNISPGVKVEKTKIINELIEELHRFIEELEQQFRKDSCGLKEGVETDNSSGAVKNRGPKV